VWLGETLRPTRDADLLGFGDLTEGSLTQIFSSIATLAVTPDAMKYDPASIRVRQIRPEDEYGGTRVTLIGRLGSARLRLQLDVGIGDAVKPEPEWIEYPSLLDLPRPRLRCYRPETSIAEKIHAMVVLGSRNSRMRDFFDVFMLSRHRAFDARTLAEAIEATFARRGTPIPNMLPVALTSDFAQSREKQAQWAV
jgi:Nucleotidyl transferase AbiEii toxin, Type IV TA system